jgi:glycosyltransferase involved in cell wall biosynthesis
VKVVIVSGIWPPDAGGPAVHAPALAGFLRERGHEVEVVVTADRAPAPAAYPVRWVPRSRPPVLRHALVAWEVARRARSADVVYATSMIRRAAIVAAVARRPLVVKLVADEAYERAKRSGLFDGTIEQFQLAEGGVRVRFLRRARNRAVGSARHVFCPSAYLREIALGWGLPPERISVLPNPAPIVPDLPAREVLRLRFGMTGVALAFAGRLTPQKDLVLALDAIERVAGVSLTLLGDGPERPSLDAQVAARGLGDRVRFLGGGSRDDVLALFRAADGSLLSSAWENFPHTVVEALAVGTPIIATAVGGVPEIVRDGENGLLVPPHDVGALAAAIERFAEDAGLRGRLAEAAVASVVGYAPDVLLARVEAELARAAGRPS